MVKGLSKVDYGQEMLDEFLEKMVEIRRERSVKKRLLLQMLGNAAIITGTAAFVYYNFV
ncbi:hypothetical protein [Alteribacter keqinensis]|uniref:hypothetical protein n=1 Tax=Alteribacter keqinensis TaxID=2483800 RepID=UPI001605A0C4|nr:hypothetical protein [Alteribacter keqinensis]